MFAIVGEIACLQQLLKYQKFTDQNGVVKEVNAKPGEARFFPPFKHKVENLGDKPFDAVYIGLKVKPAHSATGSKD